MFFNFILLFFDFFSLLIRIIVVVSTHNSMVNFLRNCEFSCRYTSVLAVAVGVLLFLFGSFSDPGTIKAENVSQYLSAYPYDNIIYSEKECSTCKIPKSVVSLCCRIF